ncbi:VOC family protein [Nocardia sp. NBC_00565]
MVNTNGIHHVRLTVTDVEASRAFYQDVLGFQRSRWHSPRAAAPI